MHYASYVRTPRSQQKSRLALNAVGFDETQIFLLTPMERPVLWGATQPPGRSFRPATVACKTNRLCNFGAELSLRSSKTETPGTYGPRPGTGASMATRSEPRRPTFYLKTALRQLKSQGKSTRCAECEKKPGSRQQSRRARHAVGFVRLSPCNNTPKGNPFRSASSGERSRPSQSLPSGATDNRCCRTRDNRSAR